MLRTVTRLIAVSCLASHWLMFEGSHGFSTTPPSPGPRQLPRRWAMNNNNHHDESSSQCDATATVQRRRDFLQGLVKTGFFGSAMAVTAMTAACPTAAVAIRFVLDEETGDYIQVEDVDWQTAWKDRLDKASNMSGEEILNAARGAGNRRPADEVEESSPASRKRRAVSACRSATTRQAAQAGSEKECTIRVLGGNVDFILNAL